MSRHLTNTGSGPVTVSARNNIWSDPSNPGAFIRDGSHNTTAGIFSPGSGTIDTSAPLSVDEAFVQDLYNHFLQRSGSRSELDGWVAVMATHGRASVASSIANSDESMRRTVDSLYIQLLDHNADFSGETAWAHYLDNGGSLEQVILAFVTSPEYINHVTGTLGDQDYSYVQSLYNRILGRNASFAEVDSYVRQLPSVGYVGVASAIVHSVELRDRYIGSYYQQLLHRSPRTSEVTGWQNTSLTLLQLRLAFAQTDEFYSNG
jgi:hypothetical protein